MLNHVFQDRPAISMELLPLGEHQFETIGADIGISNGAATSGSSRVELKLLVPDKGVVVFETLTFHDSCYWKVDQFLKCTGAVRQKGDSVQITEDFLIGLCGYFVIKHETYNGKQRNKVAFFIADKPILPRRIGPDDDVGF